MLQLRRTLHGSTSLSLGHLTTGPFLPSMPSKKRCSTENVLPIGGFSDGTPSVQLERSTRASCMSATLVTSRPHLSAVPTARLEYSTGGTGVQAFRAAIPPQR